MIYEQNYNSGRRYSSLNAYNMPSLSQEQCKTILTKHFGDEGYNILSYKIESGDNNIRSNFQSHDTLKIEIQRLDEVRTIQFLIKTHQKAMKITTASQNLQQIFQKEQETYIKFMENAEELLKNDADFALKLYLNKGDELFIIEDPTDQGYVIPNPESLDKEHVKIGLETLAKLHCASIAMEESHKKLEIAYRLPNDYGKALEETLFCENDDSAGYKYLKASKNAIYAVLEKMRDSDVIAEHAQKLFENAIMDVYKIINGDQFKRVFTHGDMWSNSVTFKYENNLPKSCKLFNFQFARYAPPAFDVIEWILSANNDFTKKCYYELLEHYYTSLKNALKKAGIDIKHVISVDEFEVTCKAALTCSKILKMFYYTVVGVSDDYFKEISEDTDKFHEFYYVNRTKYVMNCFNNDVDYKNNLTRLIEDALEDIKNPNLKIEDIYYMVLKDMPENDYIILDYKMTPFGCYLDNVKLEVNIVRDGNTKILQYFVKKMPDISNVKEKSLFHNRFLKEHAWYRRMTPFYSSLNVNMTDVLPKCYFSRLHDVLAFEDLTSQGYIALYHRFSLTFDKVLLAIKKMASLHSKTIILEHSSKFKELEIDFYEKYKDNFVESIYYMPDKACNTFINAAKLGVLSLIDYFYSSESKLSKEILREQVLKIYDNLSEYMKPSKKYLNTVCHGDLSLLNLMFKCERNIPVDCAFVDFQSYRYAPPAHDLMSFLYLSTDREFRKLHLQKIQELYYDELREILKRESSQAAKALPDLNIFLESCRYYKLFAIAQCAIHFHISMLTEDQLKSFFASPDLHDKMFFEDRSKFIISMCNSDPVYKEKLRETILDLQEFCGSNNAMKKIAMNRKSSNAEVFFAPTEPFLCGRRYSNVDRD